MPCDTFVVEHGGVRLATDNMDLITQLLQIMGVYNDNSELIGMAVKDVQSVKDQGLSKLKQGYEERKRKLILKAIALLAPSDIPAKVIEVDGVDDAELLLCQEEGWLQSALAVYLRQEDVSDALATTCTAEMGGDVGFYAHSVLAAAWDHVELGVEGLIELVKPMAYECGGDGRKVLEHAKTFCGRIWHQALPLNAMHCKVLAFEASRDDHRRFALLNAVMVDSTNQVILINQSAMLTSTEYSVSASSHEGLEFHFTEKDYNQECKGYIWQALSVLCAMFAEVNRLPDGAGSKLVNNMLKILDRGLNTCTSQLQLVHEGNKTIWIPSKGDLKRIHNRNDDETRVNLRRRFSARDALVAGIKQLDERSFSNIRTDKFWTLTCLADRKTTQLGRNMVKAYEDQKILPVQNRNSGSSSVFATYIYKSLGNSKVAEEYKDIFTSRKVNIRRARSGTLVFVPHSETVTMTTHGMVCKPVEIQNSQIVSYDPAARFAFLPHLLQILGLTQDDALLSTLVREMDENAYLVADPLTLDVRACMTRSFETANRTFRVSSLHEMARQAVGPDHFQGLVREAVSILTRLGATVPQEYINRSCFYDVTRYIKEYRDKSGSISILFDRGVILDHLSCDVSTDAQFVSLHHDHEGASVIARISKKNLRRHVDDAVDELDPMVAAIRASGLVLMKPTFDVLGELQLVVTQTNPGRGIFSLFEDAEAR